MICKINSISGTKKGETFLNGTSTMRKLFIILLSLVILLSILGYLAYSNATYILERVISSKTKLPVNIEAVHFNTGQVVIDRFQLANPKEARLPTALNVGTTSITAPYKNYLKNPIVIDEIHLDKIYINIQIYDKRQTKGNWQTIIANMGEDEESSFPIKREAFIKRLLLTDIRVDLILADGTRRQLSPIRQLEFYNISSEKGFPVQEISEAIIQHMIRSIFMEKGLRSLFQAPQDALQNILPSFF